MRKTLLALSLMLGVVSFSVSAADASVQKQLDAQQRAMLEMQNQLDFYNQQIASLRGDIEKLQYDLLEPLDAPVADETAQKIVTTKVSGIMYDKSNPSAILNIEGADYLVRSGDVINGYKVLAISKNNVTVQKGSNIYKAGVGQLVADGQVDVTYNNVANLNKKFGGGKK